MGRMLGIIILAVVAAGCGIKAETYVMTKDRVGIDKLTGNGGYLKGDPKFVSPEKKTRKIYVLELSKPVHEEADKKIQETTTTTVSEVAAEAVSEQHEPIASQYKEEPIVIPVIEDTPAPAQIVEEGPGEAVTYTVEKDDTLQKIAKKFYGSYGKWVKIYDANKEKLKNPNFVKPGTVITIPAVEKE